MKSLLISGAHITSADSEQVVYESFSKLSDHFDIAFVSHTIPSERILKKVKYFIYDERNELIYENVQTTYWGDFPSFYYEIRPGIRAFHSFAAYRSLTNAVKLLSHEYDSFIYADSDSLFSEVDIEKIKELKTIYKKNNKQALFFSVGEFFSNYVYFCDMEFFKRVFVFFKNSEEFLAGCKAVGGYGDMENYFYKSIENKGLLEDVYVIKDTNIKDYFNTSKININTFTGDSQSGVGYTFEALKIDGEKDSIACIYINHLKPTDSLVYPVYLGDVFIKNVSRSECAEVFRIFPKSDKFYVKIGENKFAFDKNKILDINNKSFIVLK